MWHFRRLSLSVVVLSLSYASFVWAYSGGSGTPSDPYLISSPSDLDSLGATSADWSKNFKMTADINMSGYTGTQYKIIGNSTTKFTGSFDGNGHAIRNLTYSTITSGNYVGLFGYTNGAAIQNLGLEDVYIHTGGGSMGGLVGYQVSGTITSCYTTGSVTANSSSSYAYAGGLVGYQSSGAITSSYSTCSIITTAYSSAVNGGIVGWQNSGSITSSYSTGNIAATSSNATAYAGGLVGSQSYGAGPITSCYSTGNVVAVCNGPAIYGSGVDVFAGGLVAAGSGSIVNCYSTGQVSATGNHFVYKGGLLGYEFGTPTASFWDINTSGQTTSAGGTGLSTIQMKQQASFTGWDFTTVWAICEGMNYPRLIWQIPVGDFVCPDGVNFFDFVYFAEQWRATGCSSANNFCGGTDLNASGTVDILDLAIFADNWLAGE